MKSTICLSMIVKNEAHVIYKTLVEIIKYIPLTYIVICDTGSIDNTIECIYKFLSDNNINGEVHKHEWIDFATNRNMALDISRQKAEYSFIFDADDTFVVNGKFNFPNELTADYYKFQFDKILTYSRPLLITNKKIIKWYCVVHECLVPEEQVSVCNIKGNYYINCGHEGDRSKNEFKFLKDAYLIEKDIKRIESINIDKRSKNDKWMLSRYYFYAGQSYGDYSNKEPLFRNKAIEYYNKVINYETNGSNNEEKYFACYRLWAYTKELKYLIESFKYDKEYRLECVIEYIKYLHSNNNYTPIKDLYYKYKNYHNYNGYTSFLVKTYYDYELEYIYSIIADKLKDYKGGFDCCNICIKNNKNVKICTKNLDIYRIKLGIRKKSNKILFFTMCKNTKMNYTYLKNNSVGGSETALYNMAIEIAKLNTNKEIIIAGNIDNEETINIDNIKINIINLNSLNKLLLEFKIETIIISRYLEFFNLFNYYKCDKLILYQHDIYFHPLKESKQLISKNIDNIDYIINLTNWQKENTINIYNMSKNYKDKFRVINNGINLPLNLDLNIKIKNSFIYSSCPDRGLKKLLELWPSIKENIKDATLNICSYVQIEDEYILDKINQLEDINYLGQLNKNELYNLISKSEYWLYPTNWRETSCITAMEMLAHGVICLYYPLAGLIDTIGEYGIKIQEGNEIENLLKLDDNRKKQLIKNGIDYSKTLSWANQALKLNDLLNI